jgi:hypothetical protein
VDGLLGVGRRRVWGVGRSRGLVVRRWMGLWGRGCRGRLGRYGVGMSWVLVRRVTGLLMRLRVGVGGRGGWLGLWGW